MRFCALSTALWLAACGSAPPETAPLPLPPVPAESSRSPSLEVELSTLLVDLIAPQLCERLLGSFIGLPDEGGPEGPQAGAEPTVGRWWIRRCRAEAEQGKLLLSMGGFGWTWLDRQSAGFRVRQYLRFDAQATMHTTMQVGYDPQRRIASLWMRPGDSVEAQVTPRGLVSATATSPLSSVLGVILDLTGQSASARAKAEAQQRGTEQLTDRLGRGFTLTFDVPRRQLDFIVGALERGEVPVRPYSDPVPWQVNQRSMVWPGGVDVVGPIDVSQQAQTLDVQLEEGQGASMQAVCSETFAAFVDAKLQGADAEPPEGSVVAELRGRGDSARAPVPAMDCPVLLLITPAAEASLPVRLRYRVTPQQALQEAEATPAAEADEGVAAAAQVPVRIQIVELTVSEHNPDGQAWDVVGGDADLFVIVSSVRAGRPIDRTPTLDGGQRVSLQHGLPGAYRTEDLPLRFSVYDEDVTSDELIGTADLEPARLGDAPGTVVLDLHSPGAVPVQTGSLRLELQPLR